MRPYLAVIVDSFRAAMASWVLYIMLLVITAILLVIAPVGYEEELTTSLKRGEVVDALGLIDRLVQAGESDDATPARAVWKRLDAKLQGELRSLPDKLVRASRSPQEIDVALAETDDLIERMTRRIDDVLDDEDFFDETAWKSIELDKEAHEILEKALRSIPSEAWRLAGEKNGSPIRVDRPEEITYDQWKKLRLKPEVRAELLTQAKGRMPHEELERLNRLALDAAFPGLISASPRTSMRFYWAMFDTGQSVPMRRQELSDILSVTLPFIVDKFVLSIGMIIAIIVTAPIVPQMFEPGSLNLLLSKPVSRWLLFLSKFAGGCAFTLLCAVYLFGGVWLLFGLRLGIWHAGILLSIPIYVFVFAIYFTVSAIAGVIWRNSIVSVIVAVLFWGLCWGVGSAYVLLETAVLPQYRIARLTPVGEDPPLYVDARDEIYAWSERDRQWREALGDEVLRRPASQLGLRMAGPVYDEKRGQVSVIRANLGGRQHLITGRRDDNWAPQQVGVAPPLSLLLFGEPNSDLVVLSALGDLHRVSGDPLENLRRIRQAAEKAPGGQTEADGVGSAGADRADTASALASLASRLNVFQSAGPAAPITMRQPFAAAMHPRKPMLATYSGGVVSLYRKGESGEYALHKTGKRLPGNAAVLVALACAGDHLVVARSDGKVLLLGLEDLKVEKEFEPDAEGLALAASASADGRWATIVFQDNQLFLLDCERQSLQRADVEGQGKITAAAFSSRGRLWVASHEQKVTEYILGENLRTDRRISPALDFWQKVHYYLVKPLYTICPKPGEFYKTVQYLLLDSEDEQAVTNAAARAIRATLDPWAPVTSGLAFMAVMLGLACLYIQRQDF